MAGKRNDLESSMQRLRLSQDPTSVAEGKAPEGGGRYYSLPPLVEELIHQMDNAKKDASNIPGPASRGVSQVLPRPPFEPFNLRMGEQCDEDLDFCPYKLIRSFPFMFVNTANQDIVGSFFRETLLENTWDFLYLLDPGPRSRDPLLLVPSIQFEQYLNYASVQLNMKLSIPRGGTREKFFVRFGDDDTPLPRYLGRPDSTGALEYLKLQISKLPKDNLTRLTRSVLHNYMEKMDDVYGSFLSAKSKKDLEAAKIKRIERQKRYGRMVKRVQRYLGLRGQRAYPSTLRIPLTGWNVDMEVPFRTQGSVRFVCVDIEAWERHPNVITEVGLAILDTDDTMNVPPGRDGHNWFQLIESYHFRISEHSDKVNHRFVKGCPTLFNFGTTEFVSLRNINRVIGKIIGDHESEDRRPVILVGHDIGQDLKYLQKLDYNVWRVQQILDEVDTKSMFQRFEQSSNGRGLANVCSDLGIPGQNFHNAGNDATYTLRAMIATAVKHMVEGPREGTENNTSRPSDEPWSDGEMDDGGPPQRSQEPIQPSAYRGPSTRREPRW